MFIGDFFYEIPTELMSLNYITIYYIGFLFMVFFFSRPFKSILRPYILLLANLVFVYSFGFYNLVALILITLVSYIFSVLIVKYKNKYILLSSIITFVIMLFIFKYHGLFNFDNIVMPIGLSFYSFKIMSYLIDIYRDENVFELNPIYFFNYVTFFPTIIAGPINRAKPFMEWIKSRQEFDYKDSKGGAFQMLLGIFEKMVFADYIANVANMIFINGELYGLNILFGIILYSFEIYFDFDALSNIAIGSARLLGLGMPKNFNSPYLALNLKDFWRRWHISLSSWFKDYLYIPLGGNRKGTFRKYLNLVIVFLVSGIWHGNTLNFIIWGLLHGVIQVIEDLLFKPFNNVKVHKITEVILKFLGMVFNFIIVTFLWLIFRCQTMGEVINIINRLFISQPFNYELIGITLTEVYWIVFIIITMFILDILRYKFDMINLFNKQFFLIRWIIYAVLIVMFLIFGVYGGSFEVGDFIYQFF